MVRIFLWNVGEDIVIAMLAIKPWTAAVGGAVVAAMLMVSCYIRRRNHLVAARKTLRGMVVLITGASSGLGEAMAHAFYDAGCRVILCARRTAQLERVKRELQQKSLPMITYEPKILTLDLADFPSILTAVETAVAFYGHIDIVINNGGISSRGAVEDTQMTVDQAVMNVNYFGQVAVTKGILPHMIERHSGHIVAVSSIQGKIALPFRSAYSASKHALQSFFDSLRAEVSPYDIRVTVVSPGYIKTNLSLSALTSDGSIHGVMDDTIASGMKSEYAATRILDAVTCHKNEVLLAPLVHRMAVYLRNIFPDLYFRIMLARANKQKKQKSWD